ncbi:fructokinase [Virgibacillus natechei]|uniref:Fructokinase n=1 Tax=Virgibacillus natechei TaxID=1216297 RepID=A0ABS4IKE3_9BACI|nr:carbohydrate kinase [Virgibacillus natechei]MBP1971384.1 fructokinase [Virgibacillus natechei]UZD12243.1 carbohydrate kinase [Virgibacillus natechei]
MSEVNVCCVGELLIDMFCTDVDVALKDGENFKRMAGGAPANVATAIAKLGGASSMVGKVGNDAFGTFLIETLKQYDVDTSFVLRDESLPTTMAFVSLEADGERDFQFNRGADRNLQLEELPVDGLLHSEVLHFGSATALLDGALKEAYFEIMRQAKDKKKFVSFDPNYRGHLWKGNEDGFIERSKQAISYADFVKVSVEELEIITTEQDTYKGIDALHQLGAGIVSVTLGKKGSVISNGKKEKLVPSKSVKSIDSTGAGDAFIGAVLYQFSKRLKGDHGDLHGDFDFLQEAVYFANVVGAQVCTKVGSLTALPSLEEVSLSSNFMK